MQAAGLHAAHPFAGTTHAHGFIQTAFFAQSLLLPPLRIKQAFMQSLFLQPRTPHGLFCPPRAGLNSR